MSGDVESPSAAHLHFMISVYSFILCSVCCSAHVQRLGLPASTASDKTQILWAWGQRLLPTKPAPQQGLNRTGNCKVCARVC